MKILALAYLTSCSTGIARSIEIWRWPEMDQKELKYAKLEKIVKMVNKSEILIILSESS